MKNILVVAFDGLDYELIKEYNCENIIQEDFGRIDNTAGIKDVMTSELFASFLTGKTYETHGVNSLRTTAANGKKRFYYREDLKCETILDKIENSKALNVPSYNKNTFPDRNTLAIELDYGLDVMVRDQEAEHGQRKKELFDAIETGNFNLLINHFFKVDTLQHIYFEVDQMEKLEEAYLEIDQLAGEIKRKAEDKYDYIIFMSDHGLPLEADGTCDCLEHNENAFYSCNKKLFTKTPKITDFHDRILEFTEKEIIDIEV